jgi:exopolysaccharide biosynthesis polyprenyl glycosylphosphotransferase
MIIEKKYDEVLITSPSKLGNHIESVIDVAEDNGLRVMIIPEYMKTFSDRISIDYFNDKPIINVRYEPLRYLHNRILKRSFDLLFSSVVILLFYWWLHIIIGILIKISSKGPVIFKQKRVGINSEEFYCFKFRTMVHNDRNQSSTENGYGDITDENDCRITRIGKILRKTNLDELPQFINVFIGNMSVVGPRPHMLQEDQEVRTKVTKYRIRYFIKPGITGLAAVNGYRGGTKDLDLMKKRIEYDIYYLENWSLLLDLKIVWKTFWEMLTFRIPNAY